VHKKQVVKLGMVAYIWSPSYSGGRGKRIASSRPAWAKLKTTYLKTTVKTKELSG
jgi:hypothetical protein